MYDGNSHPPTCGEQALEVDKALPAKNCFAKVVRRDTTEITSCFHAPDQQAADGNAEGRKRGSLPLFLLRQMLEARVLLPNKFNAVARKALRGEPEPSCKREAELCTC